MKYTPSYIVLTQAKPTAELKIIGDDLGNFDLKQVSIVALMNEKNNLKESPCTTIPVANFIRTKITDKEVSLELASKTDLSIKLKNCLVKPSQFLALKIEMPLPSKTGNIATRQAAYIPLFDNSSKNLLTTQRTAEVLGELSQNLRVSPVVCHQSFIIIRENISCTTDITNATETGVVASMMTSLAEGLPPGLTRHEKLERTNILILPGQSYNLTFTIPKQSLALLNNNISVHSSFSSIGSEGTPFTVASVSTVWYFPPLFLAVVGSILIVISAILFRKKKHKFINRPHGDQSPK